MRALRDEHLTGSIYSERRTTRVWWIRFWAEDQRTQPSSGGAVNGSPHSTRQSRPHRWLPLGGSVKRVHDYDCHPNATTERLRTFTERSQDPSMRSESLRGATCLVVHRLCAETQKRFVSRVLTACRWLPQLPTGPVDRSFPTRRTRAGRRSNRTPTRHFLGRSETQSDHCRGRVLRHIA